MTSNKIRTIALVVAVLVLVIGGYIAYQKHTTRGQVSALVADTSRHLAAALQPNASDDVSHRQARAGAAEASARRLRALDTSTLTPFADAADDYLVTAREILRRDADIAAARAQLTLDVEALGAHMKSDRGAASWPQVAVSLKAPLDKNLRDYGIAVQSYRSLLATLPASQERIAPYVDSALLIDATLIAAAGQRALATHESTERDVKQVISLQAYRQAR